MAGSNGLTARRVATERRFGYHADAQQKGLYLQVARGVTGLTRSWIFRFTSPATGTRREMGLGPVASRSLAAARIAASECARQVLDGQDPIDVKRTAAADQRLARAKSITFDQAATACIAARKSEWRSEKHAQQWQNTLKTYAGPVIGSVPVADIDTALVMKVLEPIWEKKTETATRVRQRIETVLDWCKARGYLKGENPARLDGHLSELLPTARKIKKVRHHPALPYQQINKFVGQLRTRKGTAPLALEFLLQTAARTGEVVAARWDEIDLKTRIWAIPAEHMKGGKLHRVALNDRAIEILRSMRRTKQNSFIFPGQRAGVDQGLSNAAMLAVMRTMKGFEGYVPHGFRSTFRDWAAESTSYANETVELALAHAIKNQTEAAYRRGDQLDKRARLMADWERYVAAQSAKSNKVRRFSTGRRR